MSSQNRADDLDEFILNRLIEYEKNLNRLTNKLGQIADKIEDLTDKLLEISEVLTKTQK